MQYWSQFWLNGPIRLTDWYATLSEDSPDQYEIEDVDTPPFYIHFVEAGSRVGYQWETEKYIWGTGKGKPCEVNWLDPEPDRESDDYKEYIEELRKIEGRVNYYEGFHQPPTEEEYNRLLESMGMSHW